MESNAALKALQRVLPPPISEGATFDWPEIEAKAGVALPPDYKAFVAKYGLGQIDEFLWVLHPTTDSQYWNLLRQIEVRLDALRVLRASGFERIPYPIYPESGGLVPWGFTDNGDVCYWVTNGADPVQWPIVVNESRGPQWHEFPGSMVAFLTAILSREHKCIVFPDDFPSPAVTFEPRPS